MVPVHFNQPIGSWDTSIGHTTCTLCFTDASSFNQAILEVWDTSSLGHIWGQCSTVHLHSTKHIGDWDTSSVTNMYGLLSVHHHSTVQLGTGRLPRLHIWGKCLKEPPPLTRMLVDGIIVMVTLLRPICLPRRMPFQPCRILRKV